MKLTDEGLRETAARERAGVSLPACDRQGMICATEKEPVRAHFDAGKVFRGVRGSLRRI